MKVHNHWTGKFHSAHQAVRANSPVTIHLNFIQKLVKSVFECWSPVDVENRVNQLDVKSNQWMESICFDWTAVTHFTAAPVYAQVSPITQWSGHLFDWFNTKTMKFIMHCNGQKRCCRWKPHEFFSIGTRILYTQIKVEALLWFSDLFRYFYRNKT